MEKINDYLFESTLCKAFRIEEINDICILLYKKKLEVSEKRIVENFFIRIKNDTDCWLTTILEFSKLLNLDIEQVISSLRKTKVIKIIREQSKNEKFLELFK